MARVGDSTAKTFRVAKAKTLGAREPKLKLTKADPKRFLPKGTSAEKVKIITPPTLRPEKARLLAKHTTKKPGPRPSQAAAEFPPLELPPLPEATAADGQEFRGILPSLDGSDAATFIEVEGPAPELPPMEIPEFPETEEEAEASA